MAVFGVPHRSGGGLRFTIPSGVVNTAAGALRCAFPGNVGPIPSARGSASVALDGSGLLLGVYWEYCDAGCDAFEACRGPGDWPVLYADVLTHATSEEYEDFGLRGLVESLAGRRESRLPDALQAVLRNLDRCRGQVELGDDPTLVAVKVVAPFRPFGPALASRPRTLSRPRFRPGGCAILGGRIPSRVLRSLASARW